MRRATEMHYEYQINGCIRELPMKLSREWTPFEIAKEDKIERELREKIAEGIAEGKLEKFLESIITLFTNSLFLGKFFLPHQRSSSFPDH